jgi:hypothetical protein
MDSYYCLGPLGVLLVLFGLYVGFGAIKAWRQYRLSKNWIPITGKVIRSEVESTIDLDGGGGTYTPIVAYTYQLVGKSYEGSRISFGSDGSGSGKLKKPAGVVARYPLGSQQTVYYDPNDPSQSVLERKWDLNGVIFFLILELIGAGLIYLEYQQW